MEELIIIDTQLYPDEEYEPLHRTLAEVLTKTEALKIYAEPISRLRKESIKNAKGN